MPKRKRKFGRINNLRDLDLSAPKVELSPKTKRIITIVLIITLAIVSFLSLINAAGKLGAVLNLVLQLSFGANRWLVPLLLFFIGYILLRPNKYVFKTSNVLGLIIFILSLNALIHLFSHQGDLLEAAKQGLGGGFVGLILAWPFYAIMGFWAAMVVILALTVIGCYLLFEISLTEISEKQQRLKSWFGRYSQYHQDKRIKKIQAQREKAATQEIEVTKSEMPSENPVFFSRDVDVEQVGTSQRFTQAETEEEKEDKQFDLGIGKFKKAKIDLPLSLLNGKTTTPKAGDIKANQLIIKKTLENFGIQSEMGEAQVGPTVTQYALKPADGVKLSRISALNDNLALALAAHPIRIEAPIPGRSYVGIEVPNQAKAIVPLGDVLNSEAFTHRKSNLMIALGKDVMGRPWLEQLDKMPHMLIAGSTNSGKSVCINAIIISLLYQNGPGDLKFIMVDPKRVELTNYNGIPHLLTPVITDVKKTVNALRWAIKQMEQRFSMLSASHHRNISSYNAANEEKIPYIVIVIDELADLMATSGIEVEGAIVRLAQMSRAVGIHLVLATQRPSVDVLTGLIKANINARVAFSVASLVDSRTILDQSGAEKLLGKGDMLFTSTEYSKAKRLQGAYASDQEIKNIITYLKERSEPEYVEEVVEKQQASFSDDTLMADSGEDGDPLLPEAKEVIMRAKKASASLLQRRLRVGYARAARILDLLEEQGVIGPGDGAKPREILISTGPSDEIVDDFEENDSQTEEDQV